MTQPRWTCLFLASILYVTHGCPSVCLCTNRGIYCSGSNLTYLPADLNGSTIFEYILDASHNNLQRILTSSLDGFREAKDLRFQYNSISEIEPNAFSNMRKLRDIDLSNNKLVLIHEDTFVGLNLIQLKLNHNSELRSLASGVFRDTSVNELYMNNCSITEMNSSTLVDIASSLKVLHINDNNKLLGLPRRMLADFSLAEMMMSRTPLAGHLFLEGLRVRILHLSWTGIGEQFWEVFDTMDGVTELYLNNASLTTISLNSTTTSLNALHVMHNQIATLDWIQFKFAPNLQTLTLKGNLLTDLTDDLLVDNLPFLTLVDLGDNEIKQVPARISQLSTIKFLFLENNLLTTLDEQMESFFNGLRKLRLAGNPFHCNCRLQWLNTWLKRLRVGDTETDIPFCQTPNVVKILSLQESDMICTEPHDMTIQNDNNTITCDAVGDPAPEINLTLTEQVLRTPGENLGGVYLANLSYTSHLESGLATVEANVHHHNYSQDCTEIIVRVDCRAANLVGRANTSLYLVYTVKAEPCETSTTSSIVEDYNDTTTENVVSQPINYTSTPVDDTLPSTTELPANSTVSATSNDTTTTPAVIAPPSDREGEDKAKYSVSSGEFAAIFFASILVFIILVIIIAYCIIWAKRTQKYRVASRYQYPTVNSTSVSYVNAAMPDDVDNVHIH